MRVDKIEFVDDSPAKDAKVLMCELWEFWEILIAGGWAGDGIVADESCWLFVLIAEPESGGVK